MSPASVDPRGLEFVPRPFFVTFVCMGNICRSPTAHGVFRDKLRQLGWSQTVTVASAGTHSYHTGDPPDPRSQRHAKQRGYDLSDLRARHLSEIDFVRSDLVLCMDEDNLETAQSSCPPQYLDKLQLFTDFCQHLQASRVPDPYQGGAQGFEHVLDLIEDACEGLIQFLRKRG